MSSKFNDKLVAEDISVLRFRAPTDYTVDGGVFKIEHDNETSSFTIRVEPQTKLSSDEMKKLYYWLKTELGISQYD